MSDQNLFTKYNELQLDLDSNPRREIPNNLSFYVGKHWTVPVLIPVSDLNSVSATAISKDRSDDLKNANFTKLPPIEIAVFNSGATYLIDGNHRLVYARKNKISTINVRFTFPNKII